MKGGGKYLSGDRSVPGRNLCEGYAIIDNERHVLHLRLDGGDTCEHHRRTEVKWKLQTK